MATGYRKKIERHGYVFIAPTVILFSIFLVVPIFNSFRLSFVKWDLFGPKDYVGFGNFVSVFNSGRFWNSVGATLFFTFFTVLLLMLLGFWLALAFTNRLIRFKSGLQSLIFLPVVLSMVAIAVVWRFMFLTNGLINVIFHSLFHVTVPWLTSSKIAPWAIIFVGVWKRTGYFMVMFLAGLLDIPEVFYESATIVGAGFWRKLVHVTLPLLRNTLILVFVSCVIFTFSSFPLQFVLTEGGPNRATEVLPLLIYREAFQFTRFGYSATISVIYFVMLLAFAVLQLRVFRSGEVNE